MTLVILAAGMGSRFGGLKQIEPVGPNGEFIIDYSIYDAIRAGFTKVVFIIREKNYEIFKETIGKRIEGKIEVEYVFQENENLKGRVEIPEDREKPLGTAHAIFSVYNKVKEPFAIINADDFYGYDAYVKAYEALKNNEYAMIGYIIGNTLTENGSVKRGYCEETDGYLTNLIESKVEKIDGKIMVSPLDGRNTFEASPNSLVSMNLFCFKPDILDYLNDNIESFFEKHKSDIDTVEYLIPDVVFERIEKGEIKVKVIDTTSKWYGVTYKEDKEELVNAINGMIADGIYPNKL